MEEYTKGEWTVVDRWNVLSGKRLVANCGGYTSNRESVVEENEANAHLIAAAPKGYGLAEFVSQISATWIEEGLLEIGEGDYTRMKLLAIEFLAKAEGK